MLQYNNRERFSLGYINRMWIALLQQCDPHGSCLGCVMKILSCLWSPCEVLANFLSAKNQLISRGICYGYLPHKNILEEAGYFSLYASGTTKPKTKPTSLTGARTQNLDFRVFETWSSKTPGNSEFWASPFSVLGCGYFTAAARNASPVIYVYSSL